NTGHAHGLARETIILPVLARDEESEKTTQESMFNFVRLSDGGRPRFEGARSEVDLICSLGQELLGRQPVDWSELRSHENIRKWIARVVPGWDGLSRIEQPEGEFQIEGRTFHQPVFPTENGKAMVHIHQLPELKGSEEEFRLMTVRSEGQFNTVVYEEHDIYRGQDRRDVILMHPDDMDRLGLADDQRVSVENGTGKLEPILARRFPEIRAGNVLMYYPEANALVSRNVDPRSRTPAFKGELVRVRALGTN
ncbi:MAG: molybdopterin dinucleotide binding domain-containing protein, partial [Planctomycetota bacterium]|nr:molybdopterin dinucleotide binding domain-containing protein [Planctomycetota bacterium]